MNSATAPCCCPHDTRQIARRTVGACRFAPTFIGADKPAVILHPSGTVVTFDDLEARANRLAHRFRKAGLREGDSVAILMENNEHIHAVMWAARRSGLYYVPINTHLTPAEAAYIIDNSSAKAIIGSAALHDTCAGLAEHLPGGLPELLLIAARRRPAGLGALPGMRCGSTGHPDRRRDRGRPAAVLVGHHRPAQGDQTRTAARPAGSGAGHDVGAGRVLAGSRRGLSEPGPALPHRTVGVVDDAFRPAASPRW